MNKLELIELGKKLDNVLAKNTNNYTDDDIKIIEQVEKLNCPALKKKFDNNYDAKQIHYGFGSPNCTCHINPPCNACIIHTNIDFLYEQFNRLTNVFDRYEAFENMDYEDVGELGGKIEGLIDMIHNIKDIEFNPQANGCGLEDQNITDKYEAMEYGWNLAMEKVQETIPKELL